MSCRTRHSEIAARRDIGRGSGGNELEAKARTVMPTRYENRGGKIQSRFCWSRFCKPLHGNDHFPVA